MLEGLLVACIYIAAVVIVAWLLVVLLGMLPLPPPISRILPTLVWVIAVLCCLFILLGVVRGGVPSLP